MLLDNGRFLTELLRLMQSRQADGTVWVTMKRCEWVQGPGAGRPSLCPAAIVLQRAARYLGDRSRACQHRCRRWDALLARSPLRRLPSAAA